MESIIKYFTGLFTDLLKVIILIAVLPFLPVVTTIAVILRREVNFRFNLGERKEE